MESNDRRHFKKGLQGTKPTPLQISKNSHRIRKSTTAQPILQWRTPVIIYIRSPEVIHTQPRDFMALVQRLTGSSPTRSRCEEIVSKSESAVEGLGPSTWTDHSQSAMNSSSDENINNMSALVQIEHQMELSGITVNVFAKLEEEPMGDGPPNIVASSYAEDRHESLLHPADIAPAQPNNMTMMRSHAAQGYPVNMYEYSKLLDSLIGSDCSAPHLDMSDVSDPLDAFTPLPGECLFLDQIDFSIPSPANLDLFNVLQQHQF